MTVGQRKRYGMLASGVKNGEISMNKAFLEAKKSFSNFEGSEEDGFKGSIGDWITTAQDWGWIDAPVEIEESSPTVSTTSSGKTKIVGVASIMIGIVVVYLLVNEISKAQKQ